VLLLALGAAAAPAQARPAPPVLRWLQMVDGVHGYALSGRDTDRYRLLRTDDGGRRWTDVTPGDGTIHPNGPVGVYGTATVLVSARLRGGAFVVVQSADGGRTWRRSQPFRDAHGFGIGAPGRVDARHLYVALGEGAAAGSEAQALYASGDGGRTWRFVSRTDVSGTRPHALPFGCDKNGFGFATPTRGFAGGNCAGGRPFFYRTDDGGRTWRHEALAGIAGCQCDVTAPTFATPRDGMLSVFGFTMTGRPIVRAYWTNDGGAHWRGGGPAAGRVSGAVEFAGARVAWLAATPRDRIRPPFDRLFRTTDAGRRWQVRKLPFDAEGYQLDPVSATVAFALHGVAGSTSILKTSDAGRSWHRVP